MNFSTLRVSAYSRLGTYYIFTISASVVCFFCNKAINGSNKTQRCNKARFLLNTQQKTLSLESLLLVLIQFFFGGGRGAYLNLSERGSGVGRGWALIRGWVRINFFCL